MTELEAARLISEGRLPSPYVHSNMTLFAVRMTGTGMAYRNSLDEFVWRDPGIFLAQSFIDRVAGCPLIWEHPGEGSLNSKEFGKRVIGACMFGYVVGDEVWAIARVYDDEAIQLMTEGQLSTSPGVVFGPDDGNVKGTTSDGEQLLIEGVPSTLCHLAVCNQGVWDKSKSPSGVQNDLINTSAKKGSGDMAEHDEKADADTRHDAEMSKKFDAIMDAFKSVGDSVKTVSDRMDAMEREREDARKDAERKDAERKDAEKDCAVEDRKDDDEAMDKRKDAKRKDEAKEESESKEDKRKDSESDEDKEKEEKAEEKKAEEKKEDSRKDSAMRVENDELKARLARLEAAMKQVTTETPGSERDALAAAQSRADSVAAMFGDRAPAPIPGETSLDYRRRLIKRFAPHSPALKESRFDMVDAGQLTLAEDRVYADAANAARATGDAAPGVLIPFEERDRAGRVITKYHGDIGAFMAPFMTGATVGRINRKPGA